MTHGIDIPAPKVCLSDLTAEFVRSILDYDPATGILTWKWRADASVQWNARFAGMVAGSILTTQDGNRYLHIRINGRGYLAHRLAWLIVTGEWPKAEIDHEDGDGINNRWRNLREATRAQNGKNRRINGNNTSGFKGVSWFKRDGRWRAHITVGGRQIHLGLFDTREAAWAAYCEAAKKLHGEFARAA